jgi:hypothetical protein
VKIRGKKLFRASWLDNTGRPPKLVLAARARAVVVLSSTT